MRDPNHEAAILASIEELNFCCICGKDLDPEKDSYATCNLGCGRSICCDGDCCEAMRADRLAHEAEERRQGRPA